MKNTLKLLTVILTAVILISSAVLPAFAADGEVTDEAVTSAVPAEAAEAEETDGVSVKAIAAAAIIIVAAGAGAIAMALSVMKSVDGTARQPEAAGNIRTSMMMGLVFIETAIIYALIVAILIIFVL